MSRIKSNHIKNELKIDNTHKRKTIKHTEVNKGENPVDLALGKEFLIKNPKDNPEEKILISWNLSKLETFYL